MKQIQAKKQRPDLELRLSLNNSDVTPYSATCLPDDQLSNRTEVVSAYANRIRKTAPKVFACNYCRRNFYSSQALGGHQNAHRTERIITKHNPTTLSSLGVQVHSMMLQKPTNRVNFCFPQFSITRNTLGAQVAVARFLPPDNGGAGSLYFGGAGRFNGGFRYSLAGDMTGDTTCCGGASHLKTSRDEYQLQKLDLSLRL